MCNSALSCCSDKVMVQDKVCTNWQFTAAGTQTVYTDNLSQIITGTGYVKIESSTGPITVTFIRNAATIQTIIVPAGSSTSFTVGRFDTINLTATAAAQGEFCITIRYNL
ncbi:DUF3992 domain-containing protein [Paenibacillus sp. CF384]|uniref:DUF3992 domain-containing protein n=1 Tax=Paenibacillus sp. CF384 TaxID=1884382 RepID=UPI00089856DD|nr:S-Ena type endospore appendage [Paenibacillus sp. CF384]SDW61610.1 Protein of unknown function [Paenibacillus sp. CF384]